MSKSIDVYELIEVYLSQTEDMPGSKISRDWGNVPESSSFAVHFVHSESKEKT